MAASRDQVIMRLATDLKGWSPFYGDEGPFCEGWYWDETVVGEPVFDSDDDQLAVNESQWEAEIKRLNTMKRPTIELTKESKMANSNGIWTVGDETTLGTIAYVHSDHLNVIVRSTHGIKEYPSSALEPKLSKEKFIAQRLACYFCDMSRADAFEKIVVDASIDWEDE